MFTRSSIAALCLAALFLAGCAGSPALIPITDKELDRTSAEFAADAAKRTYPAGAAAIDESVVQAEIDYGVFNRIRMINVTDQDWTGVEIWVNEKYVVYLPTWKSKQLKKVNFTMLYDREGHYFPLDNSKTRIDKIEIVRDGTRFAAAKVLAD